MAHFLKTYNLDENSKYRIDSFQSFHLVSRTTMKP